MKSNISIAAALIVALLISSCDSGTEWESGDYEVYWIDVSSDLSLGRKLPDGNLIGRVNSQVFAVGEDERWIVAARYPNGDKANPEYFYFSKAMDGPYKNGNEVVLGPFTSKEFEELKRKLGLPEWSKRF